MKDIINMLFSLKTKAHALTRLFREMEELFFVDFP
jgi:hypothetical protein